MKGSKQLRSGWSGRKSDPLPPAQTAPWDTRVDMQTDVRSTKPAGRLSREDQRRLGDILQRVYDDVVRQGVPDRFRDLLNELDETDPGPDVGPAGEASSGSGSLVGVEPAADSSEKGPLR